MPEPRASDIVLATDEIPVLDLGPFLAGKQGALDAVARALYRASTEVGFYYVRNHGVPASLVAEVFDQAASFHALPEAAKQALKIDHNSSAARCWWRTGPARGATSPSSMWSARRPMAIRWCSARRAG